ncbi:DNA polymerase II subunit B3-1-like [Primulina tabacum]|uniref:DNA polymerase II subunit B3-1-like n=1 Tax=Primulina tabacum TaxID=48773 RepID=UPI003F5A316A
MNGHIKYGVPMKGHVKHEDPEVLVVPSSSAETENGDAGGSGEEVEEGGAAEKIEDALYKFPMNRVSRIIRSEISNVRLSQEAVFVINRASEKFLDLFSREAYAFVFLDRKSYIAYDHLSSVVSKRKRFDLVSDFVPERVKAEDALVQISDSEK